MIKLQKTKSCLFCGNLLLIAVRAHLETVFLFESGELLYSGGPLVGEENCSSVRAVVRMLERSSRFFGHRNGPSREVCDLVERSIVFEDHLAQENLLVDKLQLLSSTYHDLALVQI